MSGRKGGARLAPRKRHGVGAVLIPVLALILIAAAVMYFFKFPPALFGEKEPEPRSDVSAPAPPPAEEQEEQEHTLPPALPEPPKDKPPEKAPIQEEPPAVEPPAPGEPPVPLIGLNELLPEPEMPAGEEPKSAGDTYSSKAILMNFDTGTVIYEKSPDERGYPASLTKILSAITVLESDVPTDRMVTFTEAMLAGLFEADASVAGFAAGDSVSVLDLLYGLMLPSGADCANALAMTVSGSVDGFVEQMNAKARELGMTNSHFVNPTGLHSEEQYTTARDIARLLWYALRNEVFEQIYTTATYTTAAAASQPDGIILGNYILRDCETVFPGGQIVGAKTGFTTPAGQCLSSLAVTDRGGTYLLVTLDAGRDHDFDQKYGLMDALDLYARVAAAEAMQAEMKEE